MTNEINTFFQRNSLYWPNVRNKSYDLKPITKLNVSLFNFPITSVDVGPTLSTQCWPNVALLLGGVEDWDEVSGSCIRPQGSSDQGFNNLETVCIGELCDIWHSNVLIFSHCKMVGLGAHAPSASPYPTVSKTLVKLHSKMTNDSTCTAPAPNINKESRDVQSDDCL